MRAIDTDRYYIASDNALKEAAGHWQQATALGIDTEFIRTDTFHPRPALIQISNGEQCWLVDVLGIRDFSPMTEIITAPHILKIVHAAGEDLEVFDRLSGALPQPLFDTQIGAAFCGYGPSIGYGRLVQSVMGIELTKDQCRSDWLARPLSSEQLHYACLDVLYLPALHAHLQTRLHEQQRADWALEENCRQLSRYREQRDAHYNIERINNAWRLDETSRKRLWNLILGRDALAREHNKPRNHIAKDFALFDMARRPPRHVSELANMEGMRSSTVRQFGHHLIQLANDVPAGIVCPPLNDPLGKQENEYLKKLRSIAETVAAKSDLPAELLARKQELEQLVRQYFLQRIASNIEIPERFDGWRKDVIFQPLHDEISSWQ
jgi:ribonuclease D